LSKLVYYNGQIQNQMRYLIFYIYLFFNRNQLIYLLSHVQKLNQCMEKLFLVLIELKKMIDLISFRD